MAAANAEATRNWYFCEGWWQISYWLVRFAARGYKMSYLANLECIPEWADADTIQQLVNSDSADWEVLDAEDGLLCIRK